MPQSLTLRYWRRKIIYSEVKVLKKDIKKEEGEISLLVESLDDLWHLKHIIERSDVVYSFTYRRVERANDKIRPERLEKTSLRLGIRVEEVEFHKFSSRLRIKGIIEDADIDLGSYHTFNVSEGSELSIVKKWKKHQLKRIKEAEKASTYDKLVVIIVTIEEGEAVAGIVRQYGVDELFYIQSSSGKGMRDGKARIKFFNEVLSQLKKASSNADAIIIAGPGFVKEEFYSFFRKNEEGLAKKARIENVASIGISGFKEVLKRGAVERIKKAERLTKEVRLMDRLMEEISKDGKAAYGKEEVRKTLQYGAIETLLVSDEKLRESKEEGNDIEEIIEEVEKRKSSFITLSTEFEPGKQLNGLGGIAAILRFKVNT